MNYEVIDDGNKGDEKDSCGGLTEFSLDQLNIATSGFSPDNIVSEHGEKAPNIVYKGTIRDHMLVAVKRFNKSAWPDSHQFLVRSYISCRFQFCILRVRVYGCYEAQSQTHKY
jgi:hypothetical protein